MTYLAKIDPDSLTAYTFPEPLPSSPKTISLPDAILRLREDHATKCFELRFSGDFDAIRAVVDPESRSSPCWVTETYLDDEHFTLASNDTYYRIQKSKSFFEKMQVDDDEDGGGEKEFLIPGTEWGQGRQLRVFSGDGCSHALKLTSYNDLDIPGYLREVHHTDRSKLKPILSYQNLRWTDLMLENDIVLHVELNCVLLDSGRYYEVGVLRSDIELAGDAMLTHAEILSDIQFHPEYQEFMMDYKPVPTKFCAAVSDLFASDNEFKPEVLRKHDTAHNCSKATSSIWARWKEQAAAAEAVRLVRREDEN